MMKLQKRKRKKTKVKLASDLKGSHHPMEVSPRGLSSYVAQKTDAKGV